MCNWDALSVLIRSMIWLRTGVFALSHDVINRIRSIPKWIRLIFPVELNLIKLSYKKEAPSATANTRCKEHPEDIQLDNHISLPKEITSSPSHRSKSFYTLPARKKKRIRNDLAFKCRPAPASNWPPVQSTCEPSMATLLHGQVRFRFVKEATMIYAPAMISPPWNNLSSGTTRKR